MNVRVFGRRDSALLRLDSGSRAQACPRPSSSTLEPLEDMVTCPIHLNFLEDPRLLPCGHAFCCQCLNDYMAKLVSDPTKVQDQTFSCPICRASCAIPPSQKADSFPTAFNHKAILEFLRKNHLTQFATESIRKISLDHIQSAQLARKNSIQVSSQMLSYIANDITNRQKDGKMTVTDRAVILDEVNKLLERLQSPQPDPKHLIVNGTKSPQTNENDSNSLSTLSPTNSIKHLGRFHAAANRIRKLTNPLVKPGEVFDYTLYREVENVRITMKRNAKFQIFTKGKDCCIMRKDEDYQPIDQRLLTSEDHSNILRITVSTNAARNELILWRQNILTENQSPLPINSNFKKVKANLHKLSGPISINNVTPIKIQYVRFHNSLIYLTGIINPPCSFENSNTQLIEGAVNRTTEMGILICCTSNTEDSIQCKLDHVTGQSDQSMNPFPIVAISSLFYRDLIGCERPHQPIIFGLDVDKTNGDIYVAQPANASICRLKKTDLSRIDRSWYLNDPPLCPYFLCFAKFGNNVWATCPTEDKIIILDPQLNSYHYITPSKSFDIIPSHIIYTTDHRIILLDKSKSQLFWIAKIQDTICLQLIEIRMNSRDRRNLIIAIQPIDYESLDSTENGAKLHGGIMCAHNLGCYIIYPKQLLSRLKTNKLLSCLK